MRRLDIRLLGTFSVTLDGKPLTAFRSDKVRALLAFLAVESDRPHRRDALADLLWPEKPNDIARNNLRLALSRLRKALRPIADAGLFLIDGESIQLNKRLISVDVQAFEAHVQAAQAHKHPEHGLCATCVQHLEAAVGLYRGDFMVGFFLKDALPFAEWTARWRERLYQTALVALQRLTDYHVRHGDLTCAEHYARRQVELAPWREEGHLQLIEILARRGEFTAALRQYASCRQALADELGLAPSPQAEALRQRVERARSQRLRSSLPVPRGAFIGREEEMQRLGALMGAPDARLIVIVGPPGAGKTRLALEAARAWQHLFLDGVLFVPLAPLRRPDELPFTLAEAVGLSLARASSPLEHLTCHLSPLELLLVLDGFDHLVPKTGERSNAAVDCLITLLREAPRVKILLTSQRPLGLRSECLIPLQGVPFPPVTEEISLREALAYPACQLLLHRARQSAAEVEDPDAVVRLCRALDGLPLALELAAGLLHTYSCAELADAVTQTVDVLTLAAPDIPERHHSLRAAFDRFWQGLSEREREVLARLSVFRSAFTAKAAHEVADATRYDLSRLSQCAVLAREPGKRYRMHETLRQYAHEQLNAQSRLAETTSVRYVRYYTRWLQELLPALEGQDMENALQRISAEWGNVRTAWEFALMHQDEAAVEAMERGIYHFLELRGLFAEGERLFNAAVNALPAASDVLRGRLRLRQGWFCWRQGRLETGRDLLHEGLAAVQRHHQRKDMLFGVGVLGLVYHNLGDEPAAEKCYKRGLQLARTLGDDRQTVRMLCRLGLLHYSRGEPEKAKACFAEALELSQKLGEPRAVSFTRAYLGLAYGELGDHERAMAHCRESLAACTALGDVYGIALCHAYLGRIHLHRGLFESALQELTLAEEGFRKVGDVFGLGYTLEVRGEVHCERNEYTEAEACFQQALDCYRQTGSWGGMQKVLRKLAAVAQARGSYRKAREYLRERKRLLNRRRTHLTRDVHDERGPEPRRSPLRTGDT